VLIGAARGVCVGVQTSITQKLLKN